MYLNRYKYFFKKKYYIINFLYHKMLNLISLSVVFFVRVSAKNLRYTSILNSALYGTKILCIQIDINYLIYKILHLFSFFR
jgi:hypothetical protein